MSDVFLLRDKQGGDFSKTTSVYTFVPFTFVAAVGGVGLEDVAVAGFELFQDGGFVDDAGTTVVGECAEKNGILAVFRIHGAELSEVFA